ncbi:uncharacterized protein LOC119972408 isoform X2 [Scyliorhinus canicula]|uniref:uncharacterized protein LOC119972408 isoform X2 n=1 Tax=Scyliorhinus canicula TaxID=7830 RepID=UPI0018F38DEC|nr:uncharacterized protein LOC119972408 isoform X2 [Scyliorhinus canicula]
MSNIKSKMPRMKVGTMQPTGNLKHNSLASGPDVSIKEPPEFTGITGVNMPIPEAKSLTIHFDAVKIQKLEPSKKSNFGGEKHDISAKDASDKVSVYDQKQLMERICMLEQETAQLITQLKEKDMAISNVTKLMQHKISECNQLVKKEHQNYERTEQKLKQAEILAAETLQILNESRKEFEEKSEHLTMLHEEKLAAMRRESTSEISCRDEKISKLKKQIAEILQRKSWERQQQLHELKQEVMRLSEEANRLQRELKLQKSLKQECKRCKSLQLKRSSDK